MYNNAVHYKVAAVHKPTRTRTHFNRHSTLLNIKLKDLVKSRRSPATHSVLTKTLSYISKPVINWYYISTDIIGAGSMKINWVFQEVTRLYGYFEAKGKKAH
jgi:hypothetical protein